ncbi:SulP family inorganic anion transporter, partial [Salmonella enterica]|nr:SulP family inorganic anion transporter [Salmonella enterica]
MSATSFPSTTATEYAVSRVIRSPRLLVRETLSGVLTALALIPEVIS